MAALSTVSLAAGMAAVALTASWGTGAPLPEPRTEVAAATRGQRIVVVGGFLATGANSRRVDAYDTRRSTWERLPDLPVSVDHAAAAAAARSSGGRGRARQRVPSKRKAARSGCRSAP